MGRIVGWLLLALAGFMLVGYLGADVEGGSALFALLITVLLPAAGGVALLTGRVRGFAPAPRRAELRQQTLEAELLRIAGARGGRLTIVEAVTELAVTSDDAKQALDALAVRGLADFHVTDSGVVVYVFHDLEHLGDKSDARGLLE
ncbi:MAG: hypothetical protein KFH98_12050 [Gemmatimonadetes bacterium]|nr:hypothetical protein [Gemmatimonadota bacterium]